MEELLNYFDNLTNETRDKAVKEYRAVLLEAERGTKVDFEPINQKIINRWSPYALEYIKYHAFVQKADKKRIWIVGKNQQYETVPILVSMPNFWHSCRVGFSTYLAAKVHAETFID